MNKKTANPAAFTKVRDGLLRLHELMVQGQIDSDEAEAVRDATDKPWSQLNDEQRAILNGLSRDLLDVANITTEAVPLSETEENKSRFNEVMTLRNKEKIDEALTNLRDHKSEVPPSVASYLRSMLWGDKGEPALATVFARHAFTLQPTMPLFHHRYLNTVYESNPSAASEEAARILASNSQFHPNLVIAAKAAFERVYAAESAGQDSKSAALGN